MYSKPCKLIRGEELGKEKGLAKMCLVVQATEVCHVFSHHDAGCHYFFSEEKLM